MDKKTIEIISTDAVRNSIILSDYLTPSISENDKEPSWDGFVYISKNSKKEKKDIIGRVPVQVKGTSNNNITKTEISFRTDTADLNNYFNDGGAIYFVVYICDDKVTSKIYYAALTPLILKRYLSESKGQKSRSIKLKEFPDDNDRKATIFLNFYTNCKKQVSFKNLEPLKLEEIAQNSEISISINGLGYNTDNIDKLLFENDIYCYAIQNKNGIPYPVEGPLDIETLENKLELNVSTDNKVYYNTLKRIRTKNQLILKIGDSFSIISNNNSSPTKFNYTLTPMLKQRVTDLNFFISIIKNNSFKIGDMLFDISEMSSKNQQIDIEAKISNLKYCQNIISLFRILHIDSDVNLDLLSKKDINQLDCLMQSFILNKLVPISYLPNKFTVKIGNLKILLLSQKSNENESLYKLYDFAKCNLDIIYEDDKGNELKTSPYSLLQKDDYLNISNIDYNSILTSYQILVKENSHIFERANNDMLIMIQAYDNGNSKNKKLFHAIKEISEWILAEDTYLSYEIKTINDLQIKRRERELDKDEKIKLHIIAEDISASEDIKAAAYLLLENQLAAEIHFSNMNDKQKEIFKSFPIYKFWDDTDKN